MNIRKTTALTAIAFGALTLAAAPAFAVTVTNGAEKAHKVTVDLGNDEPVTEIAPGKSAKLECPEGCELRVDALSYGYPAAAGDKLTIKKDGTLAYAGQEDPQEARNDTGKAGKKAQ